MTNVTESGRHVGPRNARMRLCGAVTDRVARADPNPKWTSAIVYCAISLICLTTGFGLDAGPAQLVLLGIGAFFAAGSSGPAAAMVARLTLTVANNLLGLALGPIVVGLLADRLGLNAALQLAPLAHLVAIAALLLGKRRYEAGLRRVQAAAPAPSLTRRLRVVTRRRRRSRTRRNPCCGPH
jgi:hypothetical protein